MIRRDFDVRKTEKDFLRNYDLHDIAENEGNRVLRDLGYELHQFGEDRRYERVWEAGNDKPDKIVTKKNDTKEICLLDWKGKKYTREYMMNERAFKSYMRISKSMDLPVVVCMARINGIILDFVYFILSNDIVIERKKAWDDNIVVILSNDRALDFYSTIGTFLSGGTISNPIQTMTMRKEDREKEIDKEIEEFRNNQNQKKVTQESKMMI